MKILALLLALTATRASGLQPGRPLVIRTCLNPGANASIVHRAEAIASRILAAASVRIEWRGDERACKAAVASILITLSYETRTDRAPGALARAFPYEQKHVEVFYDRVADSTSPAALASVLGHALAHELVHMLQGLDEHSADGLMKARWERRDYVQMQRGLLALGEREILLVRRGAAAFTRDGQ
jgi:hypothetical protein